MLVLGPAKCQDCHARLYWMGDRWAERVLRDDRYTFHVHTCTARMPLTVNFELAYPDLRPMMFDDEGTLIEERR